MEPNVVDCSRNSTREAHSRSRKSPLAITIEEYLPVKSLGRREESFPSVDRNRGRTRDVARERQNSWPNILAGLLFLQWNVETSVAVS